MMTQAERIRVRRINKIRTKVMEIAIIAVAVVLVLSVVRDYFRHAEKYDTIAKYQFELRLEEGDKEEIKRYKEYYINDDIYLFDNELTLKLLADKYNVKYDLLKTAYKASEADSIQEFHDEYVKDSELFSFLQKVCKK